MDSLTVMGYAAGFPRDAPGVVVDIPMGCEVPHKSTQILPDSAVLQKTDLNFSRGRIEI
jgi:hypothetical protein